MRVARELWRTDGLSGKRQWRDEVPVGLSSSSYKRRDGRERKIEG